ncbi:MAG: hypothetical protein AAGE52_38370 [Myxococcota bacterium]
MTADGCLAKGHALSLDGDDASPAYFEVEDPRLPFRAIRLMNLEGNEIVALHGQSRHDGIYFMDHEALYSLEMIGTGDDEELESFFDALAESPKSAGTCIRSFVESYELTKLAASMPAFFKKLKHEAVGTRSRNRSKVVVEEILKPQPMVHGIFPIDGRLGVMQSDRVDAYSLPKGRKAVSWTKLGPYLETWCVFDGAVWVGGEAVHRLLPKGKKKSFKLDEHWVAAMVEHEEELWLGTNAGALLKLDGRKFKEVERFKSKITGLCSHDGELWITLWKGGLKKRTVKGKVTSGGVRAGRLVKAFSSSSGALLIVCQGESKRPGLIYRKASDEKKFVEHKAFGAYEVPTEIAQLPSGRIISGGLFEKVFVSDNDGQRFATFRQPFLGRMGGKPEKRELVYAAAMDDFVYLAGPFAPVVRAK